MANKLATQDWIRIQSDYRAGIKTLREIAAEHGITHGAVNKRAKVGEWSRDLSAKIKAKAEELVSKALVSAQVSKAGEKATVDANAEAVAAVIVRHRTDLRDARDAAIRMLSELRQTGEQAEALERIEELIRGFDGSERAANKLRELLQRAISLPSRIGSIKALAETITRLMDNERAAWKLDHVAAEPIRELGDDELDAKIAAAVKRAEGAPMLELVGRVA